MSVIRLDDHRKAPEPKTVHVDRTLTVFGREYTIRRSTWGNNKIGGWVSARDRAGQILFVRGGDVADSVLVEMIGCWMDGYSVGKKEAARAAVRGTGDIV
ncbi:hypothetical protein ACVI1J_001713 [Bradyrhizobium diazoefficiens]